VILGYGMQDPNNWDDGRDPYQNEWDAIEARELAERDMRKKLGLGVPIKPQRTVAPRPMCIQRMNGNHDFGVVHSWRFRCRRCGFDYESTYAQVGLAFVSNGHAVLSYGAGLPPSATQSEAEGYAR
jgi:hypothetical protein